MHDQKIADAIKYSGTTNKIEDIYLTEEEVTEIIDAIKMGKGDKSFLYEVLRKLEEKKLERKDESGKIKRNTRL